MTAISTRSFRARCANPPYARRTRARRPGVFRIRCGICLGLLVGAAAITGCAGYQIGNQSLYPSDVHTVYVPMFESNSFRRNLGERLTEAVMKEIELKTPLKVVSTPNADSILSGRLTRDTKYVVVQDPHGDPRESEINFYVEVQWIDRHNNTILRSGSVPLGAEMAAVTGMSDIVPEVGQSMATAQQQAIQRLAQQIVALMEARW